MLLEKKKVCSINKIIDFIVINEEVNNNYKDIECSYSNDKYSFKIENDFFNITVDNKKVLFVKENDNSILKLELVNNKKTDGTYYIKQLDSIIDVKAECIFQNVLKDKIEVKYKLWLQDEYTGEFCFKILLKE